MADWIVKELDAPQRSLGDELSKIYRLNERFAPKYYNLEKKYQPLYGQLGLDVARQGLMGFERDGMHQPGTLELGRSAATYTRGGDIADVERYGPAATRAFLMANPFLAGSLNNLYGRTGDSALLTELNQQALQGLRSGGQLSPDEARRADQESRAGFAARGMATGSPALGAELLNREMYRRQRQAQAQQLASGVQGLNTEQANLVGRASSIFSSALSDPFQAILGRPSGANNAPPMASRTFDPFNPYAQDLFNTNNNAYGSTQIANENNKAAFRSAALGVAGAGAAASDKRLKKNIRRVGTTKSGIPISRWQYKGGKQTFEGPVAQDVEKAIRKGKAPLGAVFIDPVSKLKFVDLTKIDAPFRRVANTR